MRKRHQRLKQLEFCVKTIFFGQLRHNVAYRKCRGNVDISEIGKPKIPLPRF